MNAMKKNRQDAIHACRILNYFVSELVTGSRVRSIFHSSIVSRKASVATISCVDRMSLAYLILTLDKWTEFYDRFHCVIPEDCREVCKDLYKEVNRRKIKQFRNTFVAHIWDKKLNRPLTSPEIQELADTITEADEDAFCTWCNNPAENTYPNTVVSIVETTRDRILDEFDIKDDEAV